MSKALEALKRIEHDMEYVTRLDFVEPIVRGEVQQELSKIYLREEKDLAIIEKELKALEIIKRKMVDMSLLVECKVLTAYNVACRYHKKQTLTHEEFVLLKEEFK